MTLWDTINQFWETTYLTLNNNYPTLYSSSTFEPHLSRHCVLFVLYCLYNGYWCILVCFFVLFFYRAMHFSAKRGIAIACRLSVCLSVTLVDCDHIGWNSSKTISPLVSLECSLFATPTWRVCSKGNTPTFGPEVDPPPVDLSVGDIRSQIAAGWLQIAQRSQWRAYRKPPSVFLMVPSLAPTTSPPPKWGFHTPPTYANDHISATGDAIHFMFGSRAGFSGTADRTLIYGSNKSKMAATAMLEKFQVAISPQPVVRSTSCLVIG